MNRNPCSLRIWCLGILAMFFLLGVPKLSFAVHDGVNCDSGTLVAGDCTINSEHAVGSDVTIEGNLTIETGTGGHVKFTGTNPRQLYVKGNFDIQSGGKISYEGVGTANPGQNGGTLTIIVDGNTSVSGVISVKGGNGSGGATGGNGGMLTVNVCGDFTSTGDITAKGGNGGSSPTNGPNAATGGNGGGGGSIMINANGSVSFSGDVPRPRG